MARGHQGERAVEQAGDDAGQRILLGSQRAYQALSSYIGVSTTESAAVFPSNVMVATAMGRIAFRRPGRIRIEGKTAPVHPEDPSSGTPYTIISDGSKTWLSWALSGGGAFRQVSTVEQAIDEMTGVSQGAASTVPVILLNLTGKHPGVTAQEKGFLGAFAQGSALLGRERLRGKECYRIRVSRAAGTWDFWIDTKSMLAMQIETMQDQSQIRAFSASRDSRITRLTRREVFTIEAVNTRIPESTFQDPTR
jgi:outer membrane lipoprotein-sorting protein